MKILQIDGCKTSKGGLCPFVGRDHAKFVCTRVGSQVYVTASGNIPQFCPLKNSDILIKMERE